MGVIISVGGGYVHPPVSRKDDLLATELLLGLFIPFLSPDTFIFCGSLLLDYTHTKTATPKFTYSTACTVTLKRLKLCMYLRETERHSSHSLFESPNASVTLARPGQPQELGNQ